MRKILTKEQVDYACKLYETGKYTFKDIGDEIGVHDCTIGYKLRARGYKAKSQSELQRKYAIQEDYFDNINIEDKAYILGFFYADGYHNPKLNQISITLQEKDKDILSEINKRIQPTKPLTFIKRSGEKDGCNRQNQYRMVINSKYMSSIFTKRGLDNNKTSSLDYPSYIPEELERHFIRGYFDGDGWIKKISRDKRYSYGTISIMGTMNLLEGIKGVLLKELNIKSYIGKTVSTMCFKLDTSGTANTSKIMNWLYKDSTIHLTRKYETFRENTLRQVKTPW